MVGSPSKPLMSMMPALIVCMCTFGFSLYSSIAPQPLSRFTPLYNRHRRAARGTSANPLAADCSGERRPHPAPQIPPQLCLGPRRSSWVDHERLDDPQQVFGEFVEIVVAEARGGPVDVEPTEHVPRELHRDIGGDVRGERARA